MIMNMMDDTLLRSEGAVIAPNFPSENICEAASAPVIGKLLKLMTVRWLDC